MRPGVIVRLYPRDWRERYGDEFEQLLCDQLADGAVARGWWLNAGVHAVRARLTGVVAGRAWAAVLFAVSAVSIWSQLAVGWNWAPPANAQTGLGMFLMSGGLALCVLGAVTVIRTVRWRSGAGVVLLVTTAALIGGAYYVGHHWPGAVGHAWSGRGLVPAPLARIAWAATLGVSAYWAHPHALGQLGALQLAWMGTSLLLLSVIALAASRLSRRPAARRSILMTAGMGCCLTGALCWAVWGAPGPHGLYAPGVIDLVLVGAGALALGVTAKADVTWR